MGCSTAPQSPVRVSDASSQLHFLNLIGPLSLSAMKATVSNNNLRLNWQGRDKNVNLSIVGTAAAATVGSNN